MFDAIIAPPHVSHIVYPPVGRDDGFVIVARRLAPEYDGRDARVVFDMRYPIICDPATSVLNALTWNVWLYAVPLRFTNTGSLLPIESTIWAYIAGVIRFEPNVTAGPPPAEEM